MQLTNKPSGDFTPIPEGIHHSVCVDLIDLGMQSTEFGDKHKLKLVFETAEMMTNGNPFTVSKTFNASLHAKAKLAEFLTKWRGKPILENETIDLGKLIGASATLVVTHMTNDQGRTFAVIDTVIKPTAATKMKASGKYDPAAARQKLAEYAAKDGRTAPAAAVKIDFDEVAESFPKQNLAPAKALLKVSKEDDDIPF